jgi:hypothetical protein
MAQGKSTGLMEGDSALPGEERRADGLRALGRVPVGSDSGAGRAGTGAAVGSPTEVRGAAEAAVAVEAAAVAVAAVGVPVAAVAGRNFLQVRGLQVPRLSMAADFPGELQPATGTALM